MQQRTVSWLLMVLVGLWCLGFSVGPVIEHALFGTDGSIRVYQGICHQDPARSFSWFGTQWAVCHRCSAIYISFALVAGLVILRKRLSLASVPSPIMLVALLVPVALDGGLDLLGLRSSDLISRMVTGTLTGGVLAVAILPILYDALRKLSAAEPTPSAGGYDA